MNKKSAMAFTLSEALLVLAIVGFVGALLIPNLTTTYKERQITVQARKAFLVISQAYELATAKNGNPTNWAANNAAVLSMFRRYLKAETSCEGDSGCFASGGHKHLNNNATTNINSSSDYSKMLLKDNMALAITSTDSACPMENNVNVCAEIWVDVNGTQRPNQYGQDLFGFYMTKKNIIPMGSEIVEDELENECQNKTKSGFGCAAWVIEKGNTDYLKGNIAW